MLALLLPLRTSRTCPSSAHAVPSLIHSIHAGSHTDAHIYIRAPTYARFTFPLCFPFPSSFFLLVMLQHLSPILVPLSSFVVNESLYPPFFLCVCPMDFFSLSFAGRSPDLSVLPSWRLLLPLRPFSIGYIRLLARDSISYSLAQYTTLAELPTALETAK